MKDVVARVGGRQVGPKDAPDVEVLVADGEVDVLPAGVVGIGRRVLGIEAGVARCTGHAKARRAALRVVEAADADHTAGIGIGTAVVAVGRGVAAPAVGVVDGAELVEARVAVALEQHVEADGEIEGGSGQEVAEEDLPSERAVEPGLAPAVDGLRVRFVRGAGGEGQTNPDQQRAGLPGEHGAYPTIA